MFCASSKVCAEREKAAYEGVDGGGIQPWIRGIFKVL